MATRGLGAMVALGAALLAGCPQPAALNCPADDSSCPSLAPSYERDIAPLVGTYCERCHSPDGSNPGLLLQSYDEVTSKQQISHVLFQLSSCRMPPAGEPQLTPEERNLILSWFACCSASPTAACPP